MTEKMGDINWLGVLVAGLVSFFLGAIWYMPLFGKLWVKLHGWSEERTKEMPAKMNPAVFFGGMIVSYLVAAVGMAFLVAALDLRQPMDGVILAIAIWLVVAACAMTTHLAAQEHFGLYLIDTGFYLVFLVFMGVLLTIWR